jgi:murein DD-endopeptidase MepM/ murein hydrolase activator NlpD
MNGLGRFRRVAALAAFAVFSAVAAFASIAPGTDAALLLSKTALREDIAPPSAVLPAPTTYVRQEPFLYGQPLPDLLAKLGMAEADARRVLTHRQMRALRPGSIATAETRAGERTGELVWLQFPAGRDSIVRFERVGDDLVVREQRAAVQVHRELKSAVIRSSLFAATDSAGIPDAVAMQLADVFGGDIDFHRELRSGDRFTVLYEMQTVDGRPLRAGRVLAADFVNHNRTLRAVRYAEGWYAPSGKNMRKEFLRSPLEFSRVSSGFGLRRHPFLQSWRAHQGVDYAAPSGTRVRAASDGIVEFAGRNGGYGNVVVLRHQGSYSTLYGHMSRFAPGIRAGARVAQGESIGFVGQTGWATGPHLHYEFRVGGVARNPLTIALPAAAPLAMHELAAFHSYSRPLVAQLGLFAQVPLASLGTSFE